MKYYYEFDECYETMPYRIFKMQNETDSIEMAKAYDLQDAIDIVNALNFGKRVALIDTGTIVEVRTTRGKLITEFTNGTDAMEYCIKKRFKCFVIDLSEK